MRLVFMGSPEFAVPSLEHLLLNGHDVVAVYTQPDKPAGRGREPVAPPLKKAALSWGLNVIQPTSLKDDKAVAQLAGFRPEAIVVAAFGQMLSTRVLSVPPYGCINVHPSLLPAYRGPAPVPAAILSGDKFTGVSIMLLDKGMDTGPVLLRAAVSILPSDNTGVLSAKLAQVGARLLSEAILRWRRGEIKPQPQDPAAASYSRLFSKEDGVIDWHKPAAELGRLVRAMNPWPGSYTTWQGKQLKIIEAVPLAENRGLENGLVLALNEQDAGFGIITGEGILGVVKLQLEGKRVMSSTEFLNGQRGFIGSVLPS